MNYCNQLKLPAEDGKMRLTDVAGTNGILRIIQSIPSPKAEPFKQWLAEVGKERLEEIEDPELAITPATEKPENPWAFLESPPKVPEPADDVLRLKDVSTAWLAGHIFKAGCFTLLILFASFIGCCTIIDSRYHHDADRIMGNASDCLLNLRHIGEGLYYLTHPDKAPEKLRGEIKPVKITPDTTVADLIRKALRQEVLYEGPDGKYLLCARTGEPYLVFSVPASELFPAIDPHDRIPIVMDPPAAHDESKSFAFVCRLFYGHSAKYISTVRVLYADGGIVSISREEAEELVRKYHPEPMDFFQETVAGQGGAQTDSRQK